MSTATPMSVIPASGETAGTGERCNHCGATVAADQRYCLNCGQPCSPVRLAFLDVLQTEHTAPHGLAATNSLAPGTTQILPATTIRPPGPPALAFPPAADPPRGLNGWLRRNAGILGLIAVLLTAGLIGLLLGHWAGGSSGPQTVKLVVPSGLSLGAPAAATTAPSSGAGASSTPAHQASTKTHAAAKSEPVNEAEEEKEAQELESKPAALPAPKTQSKGQLQHVEHTTGKKHNEEIEKLAGSGEPIQTGG